MNRKVQIAFYCLLLLCSTTGCRDEILTPGTPEGNIELPDGRVIYALYTDVPPIEKPVTRIGTANEDAMAGGDFWVFVFDNTGTPADPQGIKLLEVAKAQPTASTAAPYKWVTTLKTRNHPVKVLMIANTPAQVYAADGTGGTVINSTAFPTDMTYAAVIAKLYTARFGTALTAVPYTAPAASIPMSSLEVFESLTASTNLGTDSNPLKLPRVTAKITVDDTMPDTNTDFELVGVNLHNAPAASCLAPRTGITNASAYTKYEGTVPEQTTDIAAAAAPDPTITGIKKTTVTNPLYCYEANEADTKKFFLIVQGIYKGTTTYYKISIDRATNDSPSTPGALITAIRRNMHYRLVIKECTAPGYDTYDEAIAAPPSNVMKYYMEVTDLSSHDILDNGQYFIGVSNSEYIVYADGALTDLTAFTLTHNAPAEVTTRTLTATAGITVETTFPPADTSTEIKISLTNAFTAGTITIRIGNLTKNIRVRRKFTLSPINHVIKDFEDKQYVYAKKENGIDWLRFTNNGKDLNMDEVQNIDGGIQFVVDNIYLMGLNAADRSCIIYLSRKNDQGRVKVYALQSRFIDNPLDRSYAGAFWRNNQTGERLIRDFKNPGGGVDTGNEGAWTATVIWADKRWPGGINDIRLSVDDLPTYPAITSVGADAESRQVTANFNTTVSGSVLPTEPIYFRIGLASTYTPSEQYPARYAIVLIRYADHRKSRHLFIRQGEGDDYLMRPEDEIGSGNRSLAVRFSPYNLTTPAWTSFSLPGTLVNQHPQLSARGGTMTEYPSQSGAFFQFAIPEDWGQMNRAYHPVYPKEPFTRITNVDSNIDWHYNSSGISGFWSDFYSKQELCPNGYRRPRDGATHIGNTTAQYTSSEIRQSLFLKPANGLTGNANTKENSTWGFYADGFFDRHELNTSRLDNQHGGFTRIASSFGNELIACQGGLIFNPYTGASLFFPAAGERTTNGELSYVGYYASYWTTSSGTTQNGWRLFLLPTATRMETRDRDYGISIRCVKE